MRLDDLVLNEVKLEEAYKNKMEARNNNSNGLSLEKEVFYKHYGNQFLPESFPVVRVNKEGEVSIRIFDSDRTKEMILVYEEAVLVKDVVGYQAKEVESALRTLTSWLTPSRIKYIKKQELIGDKHNEEFKELLRYAVEGLVIPNAEVYKDAEIHVGSGYRACMRYQITYLDKLRSASIRIAFDGAAIPEYSRGLTDQAGEELLAIFENWIAVEK